MAYPATYEGQGLRQPAQGGRRISSRWAALVGVEVLLLTFNDLISASQQGSLIGLLTSVAKDVILVVLVAAALPRLVRGISRLAALAVALVLFASMSALVSPDLVQGLYGVRNSYAGLLWLAVVPKLISAGEAQSLLRWVAHLGQAVALLAIATHERGIAWMFELGILPVAPGDPFPHSYFLAGSVQPRAFSPFVGPNELALGMLVVLASVWCSKGYGGRHRLLLSVLPVTALLLSGSRSGLLGAVVALTIVAVRALPQREPMVRMALPVLAFAVTLIVGVVYLGQSAADPSLEGHRSSLVESVAMVAADPIGSGAGTAGPRARLHDEDAVLTESFLLLVALELGVVGGGLYALVLLRTFDRLRSKRTQLTTASLAVLGGSLVSQAVLPTMQSTSVAWLLWIVIGLGLTSPAAADALSGGSVRSSDG